MYNRHRDKNSFLILMKRLSTLGTREIIGRCSRRAYDKFRWVRFCTAFDLWCATEMCPGEILGVVEPLIVYRRSRWHFLILFA